jgi:pimeloyl-ACP methyl ester carboxylesterase
MTTQEGNRMKRRPLLYGVVFTILGLICAPRAWAMDQVAAVNLCREYLASEDRTVRQRLLARLADYEGDIEPVLQSLAAHAYQPFKPGYHGEEHFTSADVRKRHPDDLLYFVVPTDYRAERPTGLIVFLHGGGRTTSRHAPQATLRLPDSDAPPYSSRSGDMLAATGMITVGPSAPWNPQSPYRWCLRDADEYLADVILECKSRFNIDPNRVFLLGHSMGGFGAYHHALRQPDRFAAVVVNSGSWSLGYWPVIRGTPLCIVQGAHDARRGVRWHYTDVEYGRWTDKILDRESLDHVYLEHDKNHAIGYGRDKIAEYIASARDLRRDPYYHHVTLASPQGFKEFCCFGVSHNRWLTIDETTKGELEYDELISHSGGDFDSWRLEHRQSSRSGAMIDAVNHGDNTIAITTRNVARFTNWLHPRMVDVSKRVVVKVDGKVRFDGRVKPSLATALESYQRKRDWGLIYPIKIELSTRN